MSRHEASPNLIDRAKEHGTKLLAGTLIAIGAVGLAGCSNNAEAKPGPDVTISTDAPSATPSESATPSPTETAPSEADLEAKIKALEIPAGLEPQQLGEAYIGIINKWWNAGTENPQELKDRIMNSSDSLKDLASVIAKENEEIYAPALFGPGWEDNPEAVTAVERMVEANGSVLYNFMATAYRGSGAVGYKAWSELTETSANASTTGSRILRVDYSNHDNGSENTVGTGAISPGGSVIVDWKVVDGKEYAIAID